MSIRVGCKWLATALMLIGGIGAMSASGQEFGRVDNRDEPLLIPISDLAGHAWMMQGHICFPDTPHHPHLVVINHGSPPSSADRPRMRMAGCHSEAVRWFLQRHYAVALVARLGYGATGGPWTEAYDKCSDADFYKAGVETARQIKTMVDYLVSLPDINPEGVIVVGQSAGGWGTLAYDSVAHPHVSTFINMAGGRGGHYHDEPENNCHPERLVESAARFGKTASTPMLWIYAKNDSFFKPELAQAMYQAFTQAGGKAKLVMPEAFGDDGHHLFFGQGAARVWGPEVAAFLRASP